MKTAPLAPLKCESEVADLVRRILHLFSSLLYRFTGFFRRLVDRLPSSSFFCRSVICHLTRACR